MDKIKIPEIIFLFLALILWKVTAERNDCCPDKGPIINKRCSDGERTWAKTCSDGAYILLEDEYTLSQDDTITTTTNMRQITKDKYCLGSIENRNETIAVICFTLLKTISEEINSHSFRAIQICCIITVTCLSLTLIVYMLLPKLRDLQGKCIMITMINLIFAYTTLYVIQSSSHFSYTTCVFLAASMYFGFLSAFFWINVVSINIWRNTIKPRFLSNNKYIFTIYNIYGWGCPLIFLTAALISHHAPGDHIKPGWGEISCWFIGSSLLIYFHIPILILMSINILIFVSVGWTMFRYEHNNVQITNIRIYKSQKYKCLLYLKLFIIMGITWIFEPISMIFDNGDVYIIWLIIDYVNALQGVLIFLVLVVFRKRVRRDLARRGGILCGKLPKDWALIPDEEMEELDDSVIEEEPINHLNEPMNQPF